MVPLRTCTVSCPDLEGASHSVIVTAETLYEAVAKALAILNREPWVSEVGRGLTTLEVTVRHPEVVHRVRVKDFELWLDRAVHSPAEQALKVKLRQILTSE